MTVRELREALEQFPDNLDVLILDFDGDYREPEIECPGSEEHAIYL